MPMLFALLPCLDKTMHAPLEKTFIFALLVLTWHLPLAAEELTVAELELQMYDQVLESLLERGHQQVTVTGVAVLPDGKPAIGFRVSGGGTSPQRDFGYAILRPAVTDENGRFTLPLFLNFTYRFVIGDPNGIYVAPLQQGFEVAESLKPDAIRFDMQKGVPVEGIVLDKDTNETIIGLSFAGMETDQQGRFQLTTLPGAEHTVSIDHLGIRGLLPPADADADKAVYSRTFTPDKEPVRLEFKIPTPWRARLLQKDGTPAAFCRVELTIAPRSNTYYSVPLNTDKDGYFIYYRAIPVWSSVFVTAFEQRQCFHQIFPEGLPSNPVFQLYAPASAKGQLIRKLTGEPLAHFTFGYFSNATGRNTVTTDENGNFAITQLHPGIEADVGFLIDGRFRRFTPSEPDEVVDLGVIELEESGAIMLHNLPGKEVAVEGTPLDGQVFDWKKYSGKVVLIDFWATWCGPCLAEIPHMKRLYEKYHSEGFEIVGISIDEDLVALEKGLERLQLPWISLADEKRKKAGQETMKNRLAASAVPHCILVGRDGKVISVEARGKKLADELERLFGD
jgi:thiol-disulfide isomerase/thioredoxin